MRDLLEKPLKEAISYDEFKEMLHDFVRTGKTSGLHQTDNLIEYTEINEHRINRLDKTVKIIPELEEAVKKIKNEVIWLVLIEAWCGDVAQNLPVINKIAELSPNIKLNLVYRDENPSLMEKYLTHGTRSIPKLIAINPESHEFIYKWGPRPEPLQKLVVENKEIHHVPYKEFSAKVQKWYNNNKSLTIQKEFLELIKEYHNS